MALNICFYCFTYVGQDASRSFITGKFDKEDISEDVADFNNEELRSINHWLKFYKKEYKKVGRSAI